MQAANFPRISKQNGVLLLMYTLRNTTHSISHLALWRTAMCLLNVDRGPNASVAATESRKPLSGRGCHWPRFLSSIPAQSHRQQRFVLPTLRLTSIAGHRLPPPPRGRINADWERQWLCHKERTHLRCRCYQHVQSATSGVQQQPAATLVLHIGQRTLLGLADVDSGAIVRGVGEAPRDQTLPRDGEMESPARHSQQAAQVLSGAVQGTLRAIEPHVFVEHVSAGKRNNIHLFSAP